MLELHGTLGPKGTKISAIIKGSMSLVLIFSKERKQF